MTFQEPVSREICDGLAGTACHGARQLDPASTQPFVLFAFGVPLGTHDLGSFDVGVVDLVGARGRLVVTVTGDG